MSEKKLQEAAIEVSKNAYCPYSQFSVGAAILCSNGEIIRGANIENATFGATICAEQSAITQAISRGIRDFQAIAIYSPQQKDSFLSPCGICRQILCEFMSSTTPVYMGNAEGKFIVKTLGELLPYTFKLE